MNRLLLVFNCCGLRGLERIDRYLAHLRAWLDQDLDGVKICVKGTLSTPGCKRVLTRKLGNKVSWLWIEDLVPVNVGFNRAVDLMVIEHGPFEGYVYTASDVDATGHDDILWHMYNRKEAALVYPRIDNDPGYEFADTPVPFDRDHVVPVGKGCNLHCGLFSEEWRQAYGRVLPDVFCGDTTESVFSFMCAALHRRWLVLHEPELHHLVTMDGASAGFRGKSLTFGIAQDEFWKRLQEGRKLGMGYEECQRVMVHDPRAYDSDGNAKDDKLLPWIRNNLFLKPHEFDYSGLHEEFVP